MNDIVSYRIVLLLLFTRNMILPKIAAPKYKNPISHIIPEVKLRPVQPEEVPTSARGRNTAEFINAATTNALTAA